MQRGFVAILIVIGIVGVVLAGVFYLKQTVISTPKTETIVIKEDYSFVLTLPGGYQIKQGVGDYHSYIAHKNGKEIIGFGVSSAGGEKTPLGSVVIDGVPFTIDYRANIGCGVALYPKNLKFSPDSLYLHLNTWCVDLGVKDDMYKQIIESIRFNPKLKDFLLGNTADETANWKTYVFSVSNPDSYSLKYPPDWKQNDQGNIVRFTSPPDSACIESPEACKGSTGHYLEVEVVNIKNNVTLESFINDYIKQNNLLYATKLDDDFYRTLYDKNLKKLNLPTQNIDAIGVPGQCGAKYVFVLNNSKIYILNFECVEDEVFDQILYSFKFLE